MSYLKKCVKFLFFETFQLLKNKNIKRPGFYTLPVTRVFLNFLQLKQLNEMKNTCEYCDIVEL